MNSITQKIFSFKFISFLSVVIIIGFNGFTLMRFPSPHGDEAWMASKAWEITQTGSSFGSLDGGVLDRIEGYQYFTSWLPSAIQSLGILFFGNPSLLAMRSVSLVSGLVLLIAIYFIGSAFDGIQLGLLCVFSTALSFPFLFSSHLGRPDIIAATLGYIGLAIQLNNNRAYIWMSTLAGVIMFSAVEVHLYASIFIPTALALYGWKYRINILRKYDFWAYIAGIAIGTMAYLGFHILPAPQAFFKISQVGFVSSRTPQILTFDLAVIRNAFTEMAYMLAYLYPQVLIGIWAVYRFLKKRPAYLSTVLVLNFAILLSFTLIVRNKFLSYYAILYSPAVSLLLAAFLFDFLKEPVKTRAERTLRQFLVFVILVPPLVLISRYNALPAYQKIQSEVNQVVKSGDVIMANQLYWFGLRDHTYYSWENIAYYRRYKPGSNLDDLLNLLKPDLFIIDGHVETFIMDIEEGNKYISEFKIPKSELEEFLDKNAELEKVINTGEEFPIRIYRINWNREP